MIALLGKNPPPKNSVCLFDETLAGETPNSKLLVLESTIVREDINEKNVFSRALPDSPDQPPPHDPNWGNLGRFGLAGLVW